MKYSLPTNAIILSSPGPKPLVPTLVKSQLVPMGHKDLYGVPTPSLREGFKKTRRSILCSDCMTEYVLL